MKAVRKYQVAAVTFCLLSGIAGCSVGGPFADELNPYGDGNAVQVLGDRSTSSILGSGGTGGGKEAEKARQALEVLGSYRRANAPQPVYPVVKPMEMRLMWIPDHLNRFGDLVPAHYYYLRVLPEEPNVQDAFEIERQLHPDQNYAIGVGAGSPAVGAAPSTGPAEPAAPGGGPGAYGAGTGGTSTPWVYKEGTK